MNIPDLAVKSLVLAMAGLLVALSMRKSSAAARHTVLGLTLLSLCILPLVQSLVPRWSVPFIQIQSREAQPLAALGVPLQGASLQFQPQKSNLDATVEAPVSSTVPATPRKIDWRLLLLVAWASVASLLILLKVTTLLRLKSLEAHLQMADDPFLSSALAAHCRRLDKRVLLLEGKSGQPPMTWGQVRPVMVLPPDASDWTTERINAVMLHELAHVERSDWLVSVMAQFVASVFWFNPFVYLIRKQMDAESEIAADDRVLSQGISGPQYASHLLAMVREMRFDKRAAQGAVAMARNPKLENRVCAILESRRCRRTTGGFVALGWAGALLIAATVVGTAAPTLVKIQRRSNLVAMNTPQAPAVEIQSVPDEADQGMTKQSETPSQPASADMEIQSEFPSNASAPQQEIPIQPEPPTEALARAAASKARHVEELRKRQDEFLAHVLVSAPKPPAPAAPAPKSVNVSEPHFVAKPVVTAKADADEEATPDPDENPVDSNDDSSQGAGGAETASVSNDEATVTVHTHKDRRQRNQMLQYKKSLQETTAKLNEALNRTHLGKNQANGAVSPAELDKIQNEFKKAVFKVGVEASQESQRSIREALKEAQAEMKRQHIDIDITSLTKGALHLASSAMKEAATGHSSSCKQDKDSDD